MGWGFYLVRQKRDKPEGGFTLLEIVISLGVLAVAVLGVLAAYNASLTLGRESQGYLLATEAAQAKLEELRKHDWDTMVADYSLGGAQGNTFVPNGMAGTGVGTITFLTPVVTGLREVRVVVCWREKTRIFGEDADLDGVVDAGEDLNGNSVLDSPVELLAFLVDESP